MLDLDYIQDSQAESDCNFVMTSKGKFVEVQGTAEKNPFSEKELNQLIQLAKAGIRQVIEKQKNAIGKLF